MANSTIAVIWKCSWFFLLSLLTHIFVDRRNCQRWKYFGAFDSLAYTSYVYNLVGWREEMRVAGGGGSVQSRIFIWNIRWISLHILNSSQKFTRSNGIYFRSIRSCWTCVLIFELSMRSTVNWNDHVICAMT